MQNRDNNTVFPDVDSSMRGLDWSRLYETYHRNLYDPQEVGSKVRELLADYYVNDNKGIYEFVLGGCVDHRLLNVRVFNEPTKKAVYTRQTTQAKGNK